MYETGRRCRQFFSLKEVRIYTGIAVAALLLNVAAWKSTTLCDAYIVYVFPLLVNLMGRFSGLFPFSLGEWMIAAGILLILGAAVCAVLLLIKRIHKRAAQSFFRFFAWTVLWVFVVITFNSSMLYHGTGFAQKYMGGAGGEYSLEECIRVHNLVAEECNRLSTRMVRDGEGNILCGENDAMEQEAIVCMRALGKTYPQLKGWYPEPKPMFFSDLMCQMYMCGYYFPFSMEANYNDVMYVMNKPATLCHELAHLRGFILEDEANFISYLACIQSEDVVFQYSGYLSVITYLRNDLIRARREDPKGYEQAAAMIAPVELLPQVKEDNVFVKQEEWDRIHAQAWLSTDTLEQASDTLTDTLLKLNGVSDGKISYNRVVELLLQYYAGARAS
ncbi:MAG: DUF3810 domain-containing protein [Lachnospiraceae bacterium]|nr:DUF3810 domain-containing protein [Lachnospiraceae bacterium]